MAILLFGAISGCSLPRVPIRQTFDRGETINVGGSRVHVYRARDFRSLDSTGRILRMEYLPVSIYAVVDERDSVRQLVAAAWLEYLWRFSEKLSPTDKDYYAPVPLAIVRAGDSAVVTWGYPSIDTRDDDLRSVTPYRNSYWSVDLFELGGGRIEAFRTDLLSVPQYHRYDPWKRFPRGGTYERALSDTTTVLRALHQILTTTLAGDVPDTAGSR